MKLARIACTLIAAATLLTATLPAQADEIYNLNPVARVRTNRIYQRLLKYPNIGCYIAVHAYYSVNAIAERQGLAKNTIDAANAFVSAKCIDSAEVQSQLDKISADPTFQSESMQTFIAKDFLDLDAALNELGQSW